MHYTEDNTYKNLLAGIRGDLASDEPRVVMADWLEEFDSSESRLHSRLVKAQIELERWDSNPDYIFREHETHLLERNDLQGITEEILKTRVPRRPGDPYATIVGYKDDLIAFRSALAGYPLWSPQTTLPVSINYKIARGFLDELTWTEQKIPSETDQESACERPFKWWLKYGSQVYQESALAMIHCEGRKPIRSVDGNHYQWWPAVDARKMHQSTFALLGVVFWKLSGGRFMQVVPPEGNFDISHHHTKACEYQDYFSAVTDLSRTLIRLAQERIE